MNGIVDQLDAGFVMAVILFLVIFFFGLAAGFADWIWRKIEEKKARDYYAQFHAPIGKVTDYRVISNGYQPPPYYDGPLNPPTGGTGVQSPKLKAKRKR